MRRRTEKETRVRLTGMVVLRSGDGVVTVTIEGAVFVPVFTTRQRAADFIEQCPAPETVGIVMGLIIDGGEFLDSLRGKARVAIDPHQCGGKTHWTEPFADGELPPYVPETQKEGASDGEQQQAGPDVQ